MTFFLALATLVGTVVGAGIFVMPYMVAQSGLLVVLLYLFVLGVVVWTIHLCMGEIALRTTETSRLIGYGRKYLGRKGEFLFFCTTVFGIVGTLLAYFMLGGEFLKIILFPFFEVSDTTASLMLWAVLSVFIIRGIRTISLAELVMNGALFSAVFVILVLALPKVQAENISLIQLPNLFLPFGVVLFSFVGWSAVPELAQLFKNKKDKANLDNVLAWGAVIPAVLYAVFGILIAGVSGSATTPEAFQGLFPFLPNGIVFVGAFFGLVAVATSALVLGNYLKNSLRHDVHFPLPFAAAVALLVPVLLYFLGFREFLQVIALVGGVAFALEGSGIVWLYLKARRNGDREPEYRVRAPRLLLVLLPLVLLLGALGEFVISGIWK